MLRLVTVTGCLVVLATRTGASPTEAQSRVPTANPTPTPSLKPSPSAFPTAHPTHPTALPTPSPTPMPTTAKPVPQVPTTSTPTTAAPTRTWAPTPTPKPVGQGQTSIPTQPTTAPTPTAGFIDSVGPYKVAYTISQRFCAKGYVYSSPTSGLYESAMQSDLVAINKPAPLPYFKQYLNNAVLEALPKIGQTYDTNTQQWNDNGRYLIDMSQPYYKGPDIQAGDSFLPTLVLNYTVEFNGLYLSTLEFDGGKTLVSSGKAFNTYDAYVLSAEIFLAGVNPAGGSSVSEFQNTLRTYANNANALKRTLAANLLSNVLIVDKSVSISPSKYGFPTFEPTPEPSPMPTEAPTEAPTLPLEDTGFRLAGAFAFIMTFSLFIFCYIQYCPGWIPYYNDFCGDGSNKKTIDKSELEDKKVLLGREVDFEDLAEPDIRFGKGHAVKRASLHFEATQQSLSLLGEEPGGRQGAAIMNMASGLDGGGAARRLSAAPRRGSAVSMPPPPPSNNEDYIGGYSGSSSPFGGGDSVPSGPDDFTSADVEAGYSPPPPSSSSLSSVAAEGDESGTWRRSSAAQRFSVKNLSAMKARKSVSGGGAPPPPPSMSDL